MSGDNIFVRPSSEHNRLKVATKEIGSQDSAIHYPQYIQVDEDGNEINTENPLPTEGTVAGEAVSEDNPLPVTASAADINSKSKSDDFLAEIALQLKIINKYNAIAHGAILTEEDI